MLFPRQAKKEASANSGGTVITALAGGGNQSFLTDGARGAWGKDSQGRCIEKQYFGDKLFPDPKKNIKLAYFYAMCFSYKGLERWYGRE